LLSARIFIVYLLGVSFLFFCVQSWLGWGGPVLVPAAERRVVSQTRTSVESEAESAVVSRNERNHRPW